MALSAGGPYAGVEKLYLNRAAALKELRRAVPLEQNLIVRQGASLWAAYLGDPTLSLQVLNVAEGDSNEFTGFQIWRPVMAEVRKQPGFKDLVRKLGLVEYWLQFGWGEHYKPLGDSDFECH
ncbi:MAG: hypothetical protein ABI616_03225 [Pseudomonadota bacterium]